jgi:hypothetical protein
VPDVSPADERQLRRLLAQSLSPHRFPAFCAAIVGGSTLLYRVFHGFLSRSRPLAAALGAARLRVLSRFLASLAAAAFSFGLLNAGDRSEQSQKPRPPPVRDPRIPASLPPLPAGIESHPRRPPGAPPLAGRTLDLTLFAAVRALDSLARLTPLEATRAGALAAPALFAAASGVIMHAWFYAPLRLPRTYAAWISRAARVDPRLVHALRLARPGACADGGGFAYGRDTGAAPLLASLAAERGLPKECGDPAVSAPVPCRLVHAGRPAGRGEPPAASCEEHAGLRWADAWVLAWTRVYAPLAAVRFAVGMALTLASRRQRRREGSGAAAAGPSLAALAGRLLRACAADSARSAAFLATFVAAFHYGVCLARTRLGPPLLGPGSPLARWTGGGRGLGPQAWDGGLGVLAGCALCGWSVLLEPARRRAELALFVVPRAVGVALPRRYAVEHRWVEHCAFSLAAATLLTVAAERPDRVRGWFGGVLKLVLAE